jgi:tetratricopeptide (TPR) repeat protein
VAELPEGYREVSEEDRKKAQVFFGHGRTVASTGNYDYAIDMFLSGLRLDPDAKDSHQELRDISLRRKASGGKGLGMMEAMKLKKNTKDPKENLLNAEKLLAFDPGNTDHMLSMAQNALKAGYYDTVLWIGPILQEAELSSPKPSVNVFTSLRDIYKELKAWKLASEALFVVQKFRPNDMELQGEAKNLAALQTMRGAGYDKGASFREQVRDMKSQLRLLDADKEVNDIDVLMRQIGDAEKELADNPNEAGKVSKLVDLLVRTEKPELEEKAVKVLQAAFERTQQFRFRKTIGEIRMKQMQRQERAKIKSATDSPESKQEILEFKKKRLEFDLGELHLWAGAYPTDLTIRYAMGIRQLSLRQFDEAIASFQAARNDPKNRVEALIHLGQAFFEADFLDEADDTLSELIKDYPNRDSPRFRDMCYMRGRVLEKKGQIDEAKKLYSQIFRMESGYKDVGARLKKFQAAANPPPAAAGGDTNL